ncbi:segregation and condensation protein A [Rubrimonas cliftonensis]|uniref:Segregation and condensation protein A n=1 Tax=Rubrimonas cliftonensis TaxID=89524 RepID=A0A1H3VSH3_9RHOB|nr:ScpA family protein [Rubrimonas cliftonensis]SDZ77709.1 condensin subunit ScpA [Rubrimonas cliftonensis]
MPDDFAPGAMHPPPLDPDAEALLVDVDGFEGPLDLLLTLARSQKVDLRRVSVLQLAERYLAFVAAAERLRIELAADYLVMAAWLAFLKSRLLLPQPAQGPGPSAEDMAARLAFQLERLEAMRRAAARLFGGDLMGRDRFPRGAPETAGQTTTTEWRAELMDLLRAYASVKTRDAYEPLHMKRPAVLTLEDAFARLQRLLAVTAEDWRALSAMLPADWLTTPQRRRSACASTFAATLELARRGVLSLRQDAPFAPVYLRAKAFDAEQPS